MTNTTTSSTRRGNFITCSLPLHQIGDHPPSNSLSRRPIVSHPNWRAHFSEARPSKDHFQPPNGRLTDEPQVPPPPPPLSRERSERVFNPALRYNAPRNTPEETNRCPSSNEP